MTIIHMSLGGAVAYMAPEANLRTHAAQGASADVFSFGRLDRTERRYGYCLKYNQMNFQISIAV